MMNVFLIFVCQMVHPSYTFVNFQVPTTDNASSSAPSRIPGTSMSEQRPEQCQVSSSLNKMMAQPAACLLPSTVNAKEHLGYVTKDVEPSLHDLVKANNMKFLAGTSSK